MSGQRIAYVAANATFAGVHHLTGVLRNRPSGREADSNPVLRAVLRSSLKARHQLEAGPNSAAQPANPDDTSQRIGRNFAEEFAAANAITFESLGHATTPRIASSPLPAAPDRRHGVGHSLQSLATAFKARFDATQDGFFDLFIAAFAQQLRDNPKLARQWTEAQIAALLPGGEPAATQHSQAATQALMRHGLCTEAIAGKIGAMEEIPAQIKAELPSQDDWLHFDFAIALDGWRRFSPYNPRVPFQGRQDVLAELNSFLHDPRPFAWWGITGAGGAGKTRLALELCLRARAQGWRAGFLRGTSTGPVARWRPTMPTLLIADDAAERIGAVKRAADLLAKLPDDTGPAVRLLLLERQLDDQFWRGFLGTGALQQGQASRRHSTPGRAVPGPPHPRRRISRRRVRAKRIEPRAVNPVSRRSPRSQSRTTTAPTRVDPQKPTSKRKI